MKEEINEIVKKCSKWKASYLKILITQLESCLFLAMEEENIEASRKLVETIQKNFISAINETT